MSLSEQTGSVLEINLYPVGRNSVARCRRDHIPRISAICPRVYQVGNRNGDERGSKRLSRLGVRLDFRRVVSGSQ